MFRTGNVSDSPVSGCGPSFTLPARISRKRIQQFLLRFCSAAENDASNPCFPVNAGRVVEPSEGADLVVLVHCATSLRRASASNFAYGSLS